ncbi:MAG: lytic murein transglycosylase [Rhodobacteraceae bacterium]|jgi:lytic murein transglycosylase|nr:lytic murein transglycosylase [Paracoccaceae bacterium]
MSRVTVLALLAFAGLPAAAGAAVPCGGGFREFVSAMAADAQARGHAPEAVARFFGAARQDDRVIRADRNQGIFRKDFVDFARTVISQGRIDNGRRNAERHAAVFAEAEQRFGVSRGVLLAFWALETDYGAVQGDFNTLDALMTLSHDCRRPELFQPQVFAALALHERGQFDLDTTGAWAGEIGMVQMLPADILERGVDGDGDGRVSLKTSVPDAILSGARMLQHHGWRAGEPWLHEVTVPEALDWAKTGLDHALTVAEWEAMGVRARQGTLGDGALSASVLLPMGRKGPAFLAYPNFRVFFDWNKSFVYVTTAAYFATRLEGAPVFDAGSPDPGLTGEEMEALQRRLEALGHDVGAVDGILGERTRRAVQAEQVRLGLPADAWPTRALLDAL